MSRSHKVVSGDTLGSVSLKYLKSFSSWTKIRDANPQLKGRKKESDGSPLIFPGDILIIPESTKTAPKTAPEVPKVNLDNAKPEDFSLYINGKIFTGFSSFKVQLNDDAFDAFSLSCPYDETNEDLVKACEPFTYKSCAVYFAKKILFNGVLLTPTLKISTNGKSVEMQGYPLCGVLSDCSLPDTKFPPQYKGLTLSQIANDSAGCYGVSVKVDGDEGNAFKDVSYDVGENIVSFLNKLSDQRGLVITNNEDGALRFWNAKPENSVAKFIEGSERFISCDCKFSTQNFYSHITGYSKVDEKYKGEKPQKYTWENKYLTKQGILRSFSYTISDEDLADGVQKAVTTKAAQMISSCVSYELKVFGVTDDSGNVFRKGCCVTVKAPNAQIFNETKFQCKSIELSRDDKNGTIATLSLVLPGLRNNEIPSKFPWEK